MAFPTMSGDCCTAVSERVFARREERFRSAGVWGCAVGGFASSYTATLGVACMLDDEGTGLRLIEGGGEESSFFGERCARGDRWLETDGGVLGRACELEASGDEGGSAMASATGSSSASQRY